MVERETGSKRSGRREVKCVVCQQGNSAYSSSPAPRTQQMIIIQDKVHTEAPHTTDFLSRRKRFPSLLLVLSNPLIYLLNMIPGKRKRPPSNCHKKGSCIPPPNPPGFSQLSGGQRGSLGQSTIAWTAKLLLCSGAGGLTVQPYMATKGKPRVLN